MVPKDGDAFFGPATINGPAFFGSGTTAGQDFVDIADITAVGTGGGVGIQAGWDWNITRVDVSNYGQGVRVNTRTSFTDSRTHDNATYGVSGGPSDDATVGPGVEVDHNGGTPDSGGSSGGSKIVGTDSHPTGVRRLTFIGNDFHDNLGTAAIWCDGNCHTVRYEDNVVANNATIGIFHEISWDAVITGNVAFGNGPNATSQSCHFSAQIKVNNSADVEIFGNTVSGVNGENGICLTNTNRNPDSPVPQWLQRVNVHDNDVTMDATDESGFVGDTDYEAITWDFNTYHTVASQPHWQVPGVSAFSFASWQARGFDLNGSAG